PFALIDSAKPATRTLLASSWDIPFFLYRKRPRACGAGVWVHDIGRACAVKSVPRPRGVEAERSERSQCKLPHRPPGATPRPERRQETMKIRVLVNPKAGAGAALRKIPEVVGELQRRGIPHDVVQTTRPREAETMVDRALDDGVDCLAVVGGDGTLNEVVQGYLDPEGRPKPGPELGLIPAGTGGDFRKSFGLTGSVQASVARLVEGTPRPIDLGVLELLGGQ